MQVVRERKCRAYVAEGKKRFQKKGLTVAARDFIFLITLMLRLIRSGGKKKGKKEKKKEEARRRKEGRRNKYENRK